LLFDCVPRVAVRRRWAAQEFRALLATKQTELASLPAASAAPDDQCAGRFLRARKMRVTAAVQQYLEAEAWFLAEGVAGILVDDPNEPVYAALCPHRNHGIDRQGRPVYIEHTGRMRVGTLLKHLTQDDLVRRHIRQQEIARQRMRESAAALGRPVEKQVCILDMAGLSLAPDTRGLAVFKRCMKIDQVNATSPSLPALSLQPESTQTRTQVQIFPVITIVILSLLTFVCIISI